ncbi:MAG: arylsulfatase [Gemmataceae bacterium]
MHRSMLLPILVSFVFVGFASNAAQAAKERELPTKKKNNPNIVLIFADDVGYGDVGCYGSKLVKTPNIDKLALQGRLFTDAHSASAVCTPSRYALLTGQYPFRKNIYAPVFLKAPLQISTDQLTLASLLKRHGYQTACIGKWHLGFGKKTPNWNGDLKPGPLEVGFDYYFGVPVVNSHPPFVYVENHRVVGLAPNDPFVYGKKAKTQSFPEKVRLDQIGGAQAAHDLYRDRQVGTTLTKKAIDWLRTARKKDAPFFLYLATTNIHHPFTPAKKFIKTSKAGRYGDFVHELDWIVGQVMAELHRQGIEDETLVIFTSDNGGMLNNGGMAAWRAGHRLNGILLGFKFGAWEGGHRVPFIVRWPGKVPPGSRSDQLICNIDMVATLAAVVGDNRKAGEGPDSVNVLPAFTGQPKAPLRKQLILAPFRKTHLSLRTGKWVYIPRRGSGGFQGKRGGPGAIAFARSKNSDITKEGKYRKDAPKAQLYDLEADLSQTTNVIRKYPAIAAKMKAMLEAATKRQK